MSKQSSVEWLECELKKIPFIDPIKAFEQAKAMHKEEIIKAWANGGSTLSAKNAEQYYNETFNNHEQRKTE